MPESEAQRRYMWVHHPDVAQKWADKGYPTKGLPYRKKGRKSKRAKRK